MVWEMEDKPREPEPKDFYPGTDFIGTLFLTCAHCTWEYEVGTAHLEELFQLGKDKHAICERRPA